MLFKLCDSEYAQICFSLIFRHTSDPIKLLSLCSQLKVNSSSDALETTIGFSQKKRPRSDAVLTFMTRANISEVTAPFDCISSLSLVLIVLSMFVLMEVRLNAHSRGSGFSPFRKQK